MADRQSDPRAVSSDETSDERWQIRLQWLKQLEAETGSLCALLEQEQAALRERCLDVVMDVVARKNSAVARINALLDDLPQQSDLQAAAIQALLTELPPERCAEAQAVWTRIRHWIARCQQLNEANGATIALLQEHNRQLLALVFNQRQQRLGYGADGQVQAETGERLLGAT
ncbi:MAG: flagellar export chaperone FlgN [Methylohalobius sp.]